MIKIDDKFFIDADSNSYTLKEKDKIQDKKSKNYGEEVWLGCRRFASNAEESRSRLERPPYP